MELIAQTPDAGFVMELLDRFGWPGAILIAVFIGFWRVCRFLAPHVLVLLNKGGSFLDTMAEQSKKQTICLEQMSATQRQQGQLLDQYGKQLSDHGDILKVLRDGWEQRKQNPPGLSGG